MCIKPNSSLIPDLTFIKNSSLLGLLGIARSRFLLLSRLLVFLSLESSELSEPPGPLVSNSNTSDHGHADIPEILFSFFWINTQK